MGLGSCLFESLSDSKENGTTTIHILNCMWKKGDWVVVIGGTFDRSNDLKDVSFTIAQILEEGLDDLLVQPQNRAYGTKRAVFVPKSRCKYIPVDMPSVYETTRKPQVGDLVYYYYRNYSGTVASSVSHVLELRHGFDEAPSAMITHDNKHRWVSIDYLLVLDVNKTR